MALSGFAWALDQADAALGGLAITPAQQGALAELQDVVGHLASDSELREALRRSDYNVELAANVVLRTVFMRKSVNELREIAPFLKATDEQLSSALRAHNFDVERTAQVLLRADAEHRVRVRDMQLKSTLGLAIATNEAPAARALTVADEAAGPRPRPLAAFGHACRVSPSTETPDGGGSAAHGPAPTGGPDAVVASTAEAAPSEPEEPAPSRAPAPAAADPNVELSESEALYHPSDSAPGDATDAAPVEARTGTRVAEGPAPAPDSSESPADDAGDAPAESLASEPAEPADPADGRDEPAGASEPGPEAPDGPADAGDAPVGPSAAEPASRPPASMAKAEPPTIPSAPSPFGGEWILDHARSSSVDEHLKALGVPWALRKTLSRARRTARIAHEGDRWVESTTSAVITKTQELWLDGRQQRERQPNDGSDVEMTSHAERGAEGALVAVCSEFHYVKRGVTQRIRRTIEDDGATYHIRNEVRSRFP